MRGKKELMRIKKVPPSIVKEGRDFILLSCQLVDGFDVSSCEFLETSLRNGSATGTLACHFLDFFVGDIASDEFTDGSRHANGTIESLHGFYTFESCSLWVGKVIFDAHDVDSEADKTAHVLFVDITSPTWPYYC